ncbi:MAG: glycosyltransferase family 2 protein [Solirubrobacteraceae bacterium]
MSELKSRHAATPSPLISIVVPTYNSGRFLGANLESISAQTERRWECVVVDDGSADDSAVIAESFAASDARFRVVTQPNRGASAARNAGFRATDPGSQYVTFMDSDDVWLPDALETLLGRLEQRPAAIGSHGLAEFIDANGQLVDEGAYSERGRRRLGRHGRRLIAWPLDWPTDFDVLINGNVLFPPGLLLTRRRIYAAAGPFDESLSGAEDWDMLIRLSRYGHFEFVNELILHYRRHDRNLGAAVSVPKQAWVVRCKAFHSPENSPEQRRAAKLGWRAYQKRLASEAWELARVSFACRRFRGAAMELGRIGAFCARYIRGSPSPRVRSSPLRW